MNLKQFVEENKNKLQKKDITNITKNKIKYISDYVNNWIYSVIGFDNCKNVNFIDCMCNAGIYKDCTLSTSMEVLRIFVYHSVKNPQKEFNLFLNDINVDRIHVIKELIKIIAPDIPNNLNIIIDNIDVNSYLESMSKYDDILKNKSCTILFVDPYNFGTVKIKLLHKYLETYYSELIFNYFSSDYLRNIKNEFAVPKIDNMVSSMEGVPGYSKNMNENELLHLIQIYLKTTRIKRIFSYQFRTKTNVPLYSIVYSTPSEKGLEKIKESYWRIFDGEPFYKNNNGNDLTNTTQLKLFDDTEMNLSMYMNEAKEKLLEKFDNYTLSYDNITNYLLENTMLKKGHILSGVIKPLIAEGKIIKKNNNGIKNFLNDEFIIKSGGN